MESFVTLGDYVSTQKGFAFKSKWFVDSGREIVKVSDFTEDSICSINLVKISNDLGEQYSRYSLSTGDVVIQTVGSWPSNPASVVGKTIRVPKSVDGALLNQNAVKIIPSEELHGGFLYYLLRSEAFKEFIIGTAQGAASQASITLDAIKRYKFLLPQFEVQADIAEYLENYDNLIENNNRRIAILEDMVQSLYREWFVNFRYPNHEDNLDADGKPKLIDSPLGQIPEGWEVKRLDEVADVNPQSVTKKNAPEEIGYIDIKSVGTGIINEVKAMSFDGAPSRARRIVIDGDIIWATVRPNRKQFSYICKPAPNTIASTGFAVLRSKNLPASYLYSFTTTDSFTGYLVNHATGSAYPAVNADIFQKADILVPPQQLVEQFEELCSNAISQSEVLKEKNKNLKHQRYMLLPKLISGQIEL
ncbi:restriction endonuclease subunit S [Aeromonas salmonicida subsp. achromogenes]|uniref:restriction endonuclease subunit S n=1 Tax=Aeromonas salmonicida TaxID=645 RepID=UPI00031E9C26|nr:restriction endonuclease subunit S [Aeromonas salmonicida]TMX11622.1 restriction endonuclease subunit S [Aeromonas salmonicida subsp. achromogenes]TMX14933.1 restriction endonuclease subunit S [Aeromonas salmonicida subsp. achromogenes]TMX15168.1 restriction endonuclease subunit S [Aeromonas salmonicida subsp. achromogenes]TMX20215.1 restriction endonuclease subunit S [Aeromonas salmonicida subsp. achromogenes]